MTGSPALGDVMGPYLLYHPLLREGPAGTVTEQVSRREQALAKLRRLPQPTVVLTGDQTAPLVYLHHLPLNALVLPLADPLLRPLRFPLTRLTPSKHGAWEANSNLLLRLYLRPRRKDLLKNEEVCSAENAGTALKALQALNLMKITIGERPLGEPSREHRLPEAVVSPSSPHTKVIRSMSHKYHL